MKCKTLYKACLKAKLLSIVLITEFIVLRILSFNELIASGTI